MEKQLGKNTIVLLGAGHTNAHLLRMWKMRPIQNAQLVCISNHPIATYSGMMPGVLAGQYNVSAMEIDLVRFCASAGVRLILGEVTGVDRGKQEIHFANRPALSYDVLSIGIGSKPSKAEVEFKDESSLVAVKPMQTFLERLQRKLSQPTSAASLESELKIAVVGGGIGSIEIAFALDRRIHDDPASLGLQFNQKCAISLLTASQRIGSGLNDSTRKKVEGQLQRKGISLLTGARVEQIDGSSVALKDGRQLQFDVVIWATSAVAPDLLSEIDLAKEESGFLQTRPTLQTLDDDSIFAVGDSGSMVGFDLPKAGVFAVRQGPVMWENLQRFCNNRKLTEYSPQRKFLKLINTADGKGIAERGNRSSYSRWAWHLKNRIDSKFMRMYQDYSPSAMAAVVASSEEPEMRCLGCGGKIGSQLLSSVLDEIEVPQHSEVIIGLDNPDDAAIMRTKDNQVTVTTDFFASPLDDPYLTGRIAVLNSVSDCFVMGARPTGALAMVQLPLGHAKAQRQVMKELMAGAVEELAHAGATIVGGHSIEGPRLLAGFTVLGNQIFEPKTKGLLEVGDQLVLTKPIGSGILLAALMQGKLPARFYQPMIDSMLKSNQIALKLMQEFGIQAMTDVTGFGLAGHAAEMLKAIGLSAEIKMADVPLMGGVQDLVEQGVESTLAPDNRYAAAKIELVLDDVESSKYSAIFDPQTCGGLLFGVKRDQTQSVIDYLGANGFDRASVIGQIKKPESAPALMVV